MGRFSRSGLIINFFDNVAFFFLRKFLPYPKQVIDLTFDDDRNNNDDDDDNDVIKVSHLRMYEVLNIIWS
jgi:hypothetical protein